MTTVDERRDIWIAFVLSVAVPGAGQMWKRSWWGVAWLLAAALLMVFWGLVAENSRPARPALAIVSFLILGIASGLHASRIAARAARDADAE